MTTPTATQLDAEDPLAGLRARFELPEGVYLVGNSLGALPRAARDHVQVELDRWSTLGADGHFTGDLAWRDYHELVTDQLAGLVGARPEEVVAMNSLTVNLHMLMVSFYRPTPTRHKILIEEHAFPSDHFAAESQIRQRGFDPVESLVTVGPRPGEETLHPDDILAAISHHGESLALILLPGVQYFTGQVLPMEAITAAGHAVGASVGFDLAHAAGNIPMALHDWDVDFAAWCTYKYLNSGPGSVGVAFVHQRHVADPDLPRLLGWWGTAVVSRFEMATVFDAIPTVEAWQVSNAPVLPLAVLRASLDLFDEAGGMAALRAKSERQIAFLDALLTERLAGAVDCLTPPALADRGCQFALRVRAGDGRRVFEQLGASGVHCDWREPDVIRAAPVPLYNSFADIERFVDCLTEVVR